MVTHRRAPEGKRERRWAWWPAFLNRPFFARSSRTIFLVPIIPVSIVFYAVTFSTPSTSKFRVIRQDKPALSNSATISDIPFHSTRSHYSFHTCDITRTMYESPPPELFPRRKEKNRSVGIFRDLVSETRYIRKRNGLNIVDSLCLRDILCKVVTVYIDNALWFNKWVFLNTCNTYKFAISIKIQ